MILSETIFIDRQPVGVVCHDSHTGQVKFSPIQGKSPLPDKRWRNVDELKRLCFGPIEKMKAHEFKREFLNLLVRITSYTDECN